MESSKENDISLPTFNLSITIREDPVLWAREIRELFDIKLEEQYKCTSSRRLYLYLREKIEAAGIFVHCFTDVPTYADFVRRIRIINTISIAQNSTGVDIEDRIVKLKDYIKNM